MIASKVWRGKERLGVVRGGKHRRGEGRGEERGGEGEMRFMPFLLLVLNIFIFESFDFILDSTGHVPDATIILYFQRHYIRDIWSYVSFARMHKSKSCDFSRENPMPNFSFVTKIL